MRARTRPLAIVLVAGFRLLCAALVALPIAVAFGRPASEFPHGDAVLFEPGAELLVEVLRVHFDSLRNAMTLSCVLAFVLALPSLLATAALVVALASDERLRLGTWVSRALSVWPSFVGLWGIALLASGVLGLVMALVEVLAIEPLSDRMNERSGDLMLIAGLGVTVLVMLSCSILADLARAAIVRFDGTLRSAIRCAGRTLRQRPGAVLLGWLAPALWSLAIVLGAAWLTTRARLDRPGAPAVLSVMMIHALVVLALTALRATWLARALRLVTRLSIRVPPPAPVDIPEDSAAPADPS